MFFKIAIISLALCAARAEDDCKISVYQPVCASNGIAYANNCQFLKSRKELIDKTSERIQILKLGECGVRDAGAVSCPQCPPREQPVCASDGLTYKNTCVFRCHRVPTFERTGEKIRIVKTGDCLGNVTRDAAEEAVLAKFNSEPL